MAYCKTIQLENGGVAILRLSGKRPAKCLWCDRDSTRLCDFDISERGAFELQKTCDAPMCSEHAKHVGPNRDLCRVHRDQDEHEQFALDF